MTQIEIQLQAELEIANRRIAELETRLTGVVGPAQVSFREIVENQTELICVYNPDFIVQYANTAYCQEFGGSCDGFVGQSFLPRIPIEDRATAVAKVRNLTPEQPTSLNVHSSLRADGSIVWIEWTDRAILDGNGQIVAFQSVGRDVTQRYHAEANLRLLNAELIQHTAALQEAHTFLQSILDTLPSHIAVLDRDGVISLVNAAWTRFGQENGLPLEIGHVGTSYLEVCDPVVGTDENDAHTVSIAIRKVLAGEQDQFYWEYPCHSPNEKRWFAMHVVAFNETAPRRVVVSHSAITERVEAEIAVSASHDQLKNILNSIEDAIWIYSLTEQRTILINPSFEKIYGVSIAAAMADPFFYRQIVHPDDLVRVETIFQQIASEGYVELEFRTVLPGQAVRWVLMRSWLRCDAKGRPYRLDSISSDITGRKEAEAALIHLNETLEQRVNERTADLEHTKTRFETIFNNSGDGIVLLHATAGILQGNPAFSQMVGRVPEAYTHRSFQSLLNSDDVSTVDFAIQRALTAHIKQQFNVRLPQPGLTSLEVEVDIAPILTTGQDHSTLVCILRDISERRRAEQNLAEERNLLRTLVDAIPYFVYIKDTSHRLLLTNATHARSLGLRDTAEAIGKSDSDFFTPEMEAVFRADEVALFETGQPVIDREERSIGEDRTVIWALTTKIPLHNLKGELIGLVGITRDITERKRGEELLNFNREQLQESQQMLQTILDTLPVAVFWKDHKLVYMGCNQRFAQHAGVQRPADIIGKTDADLSWPPEYAERYVVDDQYVVMSGHSKLAYEQRRIIASGQELVVQTNRVPLHNMRGQTIGVLGAYVDVSLLKQVENALRTSEERYRTVINTMSEGVVIYDLEGRITALNPAAANIFGVPAHRLIGYNLNDFEVAEYDEHGRRLSRSESPAQITLATQQAQHDVVLGIEFQGAPRIWLTVNTEWLQLDEPQARGVLSTFSDITARKLAEDELRRVTDQFQTVMDHSTASIFMKDIEGRVMLINHQTERDLHVMLDEMRGQTEERFVSPETYAEYQRTDSEVLRTRKSMSYEISLDDRVFWVTKFPIFDQDGNIDAIGGVSSDITERKRYEESLERALQKEKELGDLKFRLVSMASHEFRTPLATILVATDILKNYRPRLDDAEIDRRLQKIQDQVDHLRKVIDDVLVLSQAQQARPIDFTPVETDMDAFCRELLEEFQSFPEMQHTFDYACTPSPLCVSIDLRLMRQALANLLANAIKYAPHNKLIRVSVWHEGTDLFFSIADGGIGIPEADLKRLFDPFYRGANVGVIPGTGLGLAIVKQAIDLHQGTILVDSQVEVGTTITLKLPIVCRP
jgi:PAS domain S-box-containing protein